MRALMDTWHDGGWGMIPTLVSGVVLLVVAARYAVSPDSRRVPLLLGTGALTLFAGSLGFVSGVITTSRAALEVEKRPIILLVGFGESLVNVAFALCFLVLAALAVCVGAARIGRGPRAPQGATATAVTA